MIMDKTIVRIEHGQKGHRFTGEVVLSWDTDISQILDAVDQLIRGAGYYPKGTLDYMEEE